MASIHTLKPEYKVLACEVLDRPQKEAALALLHRIAAQVEPLLRQRQWSVGRLEEFYPQSRLLGLNVNGGQKICLRLRKALRPPAFFAYEELLDTMLHEIAHIQVGPHNDKFYRLWDELRAATEALLAKPMDAQQGHRLGGRAVVAVSSAAADAAQRRASAQLRLGQGRCVGGCANPGLQSPAEMAARAALRRAADDVWCGSAAAQPAHTETPPRTCPACTYHNVSHAPHCTVCLTPILP
eukprot:EG_transcript_25461